MQWLPIIPGGSIAHYADFLDIPKRLARLLGRFLSAISQQLGYPVVFSLPPDIVEFSNNPSAQKALRILHKLHQAGIVKSFSTSYDSWFPDEPHNYLTMAELTLSNRFGFSGRGADMFDRSQTLWPCLGEAIERHSMDDAYVTQLPNILASVHDLKKTGKTYMDISPSAVAGIDPEIRTKPNDRYQLYYDEHSTFTWTYACRLNDDSPILAPLQLFSFKHVRDHVQKMDGTQSKSVEPLLSPAITTGAAAGQSLADAIVRGTFEVIERDAFMIYWLNQIPARRILLESFTDSRIRQLAIIAEEYLLEVHLLYLQTDFPVHTVCAVVIDRTGVGPAVLVGAKTGFELDDVVYGALGETLALRSGNRRIMARFQAREVESDNVYEMNHIERMLFWYKADHLNLIDRFISGEEISVDKLPKFSHVTQDSHRLTTVRNMLATGGYEAVYKEILRPDIRRITEGLSVVMVRIPLLQPVYLEECAVSSYGHRLSKIPEMLGHTPRIPYVEVPHPFP